MKRRINVHTGEIMAGQGDVVLNSETDKECIVIVAHDATKKIGCLGHAMFLSEKLNTSVNSCIMKDVSGAIDEMLEDMTLLGSTADNIEISLVAGENIKHKEEDIDFLGNINSAIGLLKEKHVRLKDNVTNRMEKRHISLDVESGQISML